MLWLGTPAAERAAAAAAPGALAGRAARSSPRGAPKRPQPEPEAAPAAAPPAEARGAAPPRPVVVTPALARAAVRAALRHARVADPDARVDALASRARSSALLPELRLRATRLVDEAESLSPTEYDPGRTTATGGTSAWIEARTTWRLDRLVFADEEVALERMRYDRAEARTKVQDRALELLFAWQRARAAQEDPASTPDERLDATLAVLEAEASLDVITGGWFAADDGQRAVARRRRRPRGAPGDEVRLRSDRPRGRSSPR